MRINNLITENIVLPTSDLILKKSIHRQLAFLKKSQFWGKVELENYQNEKLQTLIDHSYKNVPYYRELFNRLKLKPEDIKCVRDLNKLPVLKKSTLKANIKKFQANNINIKKEIYSSSSGSTGEPLQFYRSKLAESMINASALRGWYWMGFRLGDKFIKLSQNPRSNIKRLQDKFTRNKYLFTQQLNDEAFELIVNEIINYQPLFLRSYPDPLHFLLNYIEKKKISVPRLYGINTTGNILFPSVREKAEKIFQCKVFDQFSCEGGAIVYECPSHDCYHSAMEYAVTEVLDSNDNPAQKGRLITTDLWNFATPFIRYDTQDIVEIYTGNCKCGRELLPIKKIYGRDSDILITASGKYLIVHNFTGYFEWIKEVEHFQVRQKKIDQFDILLKVNGNFKKEQENEIKNYWRKYIGSGNEVNIRIVDKIPLERSGKRRFLIRSNDIELEI